MVRLRLDSAEDHAALLARAADTLRQGGTVAFPTDTLYGLAADPSNPRAIAQLYRIKGRQVDRAIPLIAASRTQIEALAGILPPTGRSLADCLWPGPLTIVIAAWPSLADAIHGGTGTVAIRVPDHPVARGLAAAFGAPVTSTSANRSGAPAPMSADGVDDALGDDVDLLLDAGPCPGGPPSTIVDVTGARPRLVRAGAVSWERVLECLQ
jgi:L-threonylcarbamoyladenylate synthase